MFLRPRILIIPNETRKRKKDKDVSLCVNRNPNGDCESVTWYVTLFWTRVTKKISSFAQTPFLVCFYPVSNEILYILYIKKRLKQNHRGYTIFIFTTIYIIHIF